jgi:hypothetical protein
MSTLQLERDTLQKFTFGGGYNTVASATSTGSDVLSFFSKPIEDYRISVAARPAVKAGVATIDAKFYGGIEQTVQDILLAEIKQSDTATAKQSGWDSTTGETVLIAVPSFVKFMKVVLSTFTVNSASITAVAITSNVLTVTATNTFNIGDQVTITGLSTATYLNNQTVTILTRSGSQFTAAFTHANDSQSDSGTATLNAVSGSAQFEIIAN